jgi:hypothetical protein
MVIYHPIWRIHHGYIWAKVSIFSTSHLHLVEWLKTVGGADDNEALSSD